MNLSSLNHIDMTQPFQFPNGQLAHSAEDLLQLCQQFPDDGTNYLIREDLEKWLAYIGKEDIAQCAVSARQTTGGDRQKLEDFLTKCHTLSSPEADSTPDPVVETKRDPTETETKTVSPSTSTAQSDTTSSKPSFFRMIARLIINIFYRPKN